MPLVIFTTKNFLGGTAIKKHQEAGVILVQVRNRGNKAPSNDPLKIPSEDGDERPRKPYRTKRDKKFLFDHAGAKFYTSLLTLVLGEPSVEYHIPNPRVQKFGQSIVSAMMKMCLATSASGELQKPLGISSMIS